MTQNTVQQIEANIKAAREHVELDKALDRLENHRDFKLVIVDGYLNKEAIRLVHLKADPMMQTPERQASVVGQIDAIGGLLQYFRTIGQNAAMAGRSIDDSEAALEEINREGGAV